MSRTSKKALLVRWLLGEAYSRDGDAHNAVVTLRDTLEDMPRQNSMAELQSNILLSLGSALTDKGDITASLPVLQQAYHAFVKLHDGRGASKALILIAVLYDRARDAGTALRYYSEANRAYSADAGLLIAIRNGRGLALLEQKRYAPAEREFISAEAVARQLKSPFVYAQLMANLAWVRLCRGNLDGADAAVRRGLAISAAGNAHAARPPLIALAADVAWRRGMRGVAKRLIAQRFAGVDLQGTILADRDAHDTAYRVYRGTGDTALALAHLAAVKRLDDQATAIARSSSAALAAARFDYTNQELRIAKLEAVSLQRRVAFERSTARTQRQTLLGAVGATLLIILMLAAALWAIRRSRNDVREANALLEGSNAALQRALVAKSEFLATTSHEIRTPLNGILGMTQVLMSDARLERNVRERVQVVHGAGMTMRALVDDILDMAKIESGRLSICAAPFDLSAVVDDVRGLWGPVAAAKKLNLRVSYEGVSGPLVGDGGRIRQIMSNLLSNAVKFTESGEVLLHVASAHGRLRVAVSDSGMGIPDDKRDIIFEKFRQMDAGITRRFGGTGLGLAICRELARAMGGDVTVAAREGGGSIFSLDLPVTEHQDEGEAGPEQNSMELLIVGHNPIARATLKTIFDAIGDVEAVATTTEAVRRLGERGTKRILVDGPSTSADLCELLQAGDGASLHLLRAADDASPAPAAARVIRRPIGRLALLETVKYDLGALEPEAV